MGPESLDRVDQGILFLLQQNARNVTTEEIGEKVGVSGSTAAARIKQLEERGIVTGYWPRVDYAEAGFDQHLLIVGTVPPDRRENSVEDVIDVPGVVHVRELATHQENVSIELVGASQKEVEQRIEALNDLGVEVVRTEVLKREFDCPFDGFGKQYVSEH